MSESAGTPAGSSALTTLGGVLAQAGAASLAGRPDQLAESLLRASLALWEDPQTRPQLLADLIAALTGTEGADKMREFLSAQSSQLFRAFGKELNRTTATDLNEAANILGVPSLNINAAQAQVWGMVILRYVLAIEPIASASPDELVALLGPTIQRYLGGGLTRDRASGN